MLGVETGGVNKLTEFIVTNFHLILIGLQQLEKMALLKVENDPKITTFFNLIQNITSLIEKNPIISQACEIKQSGKLNLLFKTLIVNAGKATPTTKA